jgi:hypothetical protein
VRSETSNLASATAIYNPRKKETRRWVLFPLSLFHAPQSGLFCVRKGQRLTLVGRVVSSLNLCFLVRPSKTLFCCARVVRALGGCYIFASCVCKRLRASERERNRLIYSIARGCAQAIKIKPTLKDEARWNTREKKAHKKLSPSERASIVHSLRDKPVRAAGQLVRSPPASSP